MKRVLATLTVAAALALPSAAAAHPNLAVDASQSCNTADGTVTLIAHLSNEGFDTVATASDSQAGGLGTKPAPAEWVVTVPGPDRPAGVVTFEWNATDGDGGTLTADYAAATGCVVPPTTTTTTTTPPPPTTTTPGTTHIGGPPATASSPRKPSEASPAAPRASINSPKELPYTGAPALGLVLAGLGVLIFGVLIALAVRHKPTT